MNKKTKSICLGIIVAAIIFVFDQWSKLVILAQPELSNNHFFEITSFFNIVLVFNRGVSFGMLAGHNQPLMLICLAIIITVILFIWLLKNESMLLATAIGSVIGGAVGNITDRILYGAVVDFLDFHIAGMHWPAFNIADSFVFIGVVVLCLHSIFFEKKNPV